MAHRHRQTTFEAGQGNALQACIATLLQTERLEDVPDFVKLLGANYAEGLNAFLANNLPKLAFVKTAVTAEDAKLPFPSAPGTRCVLTGRSPRGDHKHAVVGVVGGDGSTVSVLFDPHPDDKGLQPPFAWAGFLVVR
eukprot:GDKH01003168.1.p2 GENE.GDKH01003168.1~~GDKH01003168.1.p2  ORF type:complete len:137 (-),score=12.09 GDKH01003168.1:76-486(-)